MPPRLQIILIAKYMSSYPVTIGQINGFLVSYPRLCCQYSVILPKILRHYMPINFYIDLHMAGGKLQVPTYQGVT